MSLSRKTSSSRCCLARARARACVCVCVCDCSHLSFVQSCPHSVLLFVCVCACTWAFSLSLCRPLLSMCGVALQRMKFKRQQESAEQTFRETLDEERKRLQAEIEVRMCVCVCVCVCVCLLEATIILLPRKHTSLPLSKHIHSHTHTHTHTYSHTHALCLPPSPLPSPTLPSHPPLPPSFTPPRLPGRRRGVPSTSASAARGRLQRRSYPLRKRGTRKNCPASSDRHRLSASRGRKS